MGNEDAASLGPLGDDVSSIIILGQSAWTFYDGRDFHGTNSVCLYPNFKFNDDSEDRSLHVGLYPTPSHFQISDNNIESIALSLKDWFSLPLAGCGAVGRSLKE
ncbi:hypothetical protein C7M84_010190 [Penaeus vannamei]|uniref:Uncharacterized protein n=1 Tax=Penaeus vannamei TaxID=6689 RepID=A0A423T4R5_PENVA|nr:hypothetical protein C7M84_010190 [Penaeus vannamei]